MGTGIKGFKSQKILKQKLKGYTEDQSVDYERYATIQELTGDKHGVDVVIHGAFNVNSVPLTVDAGSNIRVLKIISHGASKGDQIRFIVSGIEAAVLSTPDADTIVLGSELSFDPTGLTVNVVRHITPSYNADGSLNVLASQGPTQFNQNGSVVEVTEDTAVPSNNKPAPSGLMIKKDDGNYYPVTLDTTNPYAHTPIPVAITDVTGTSNVTINAGDIQVGIKHNGADPSSVRIGDGTTLAAITLTNELKTSDATAATKLDTIHSDLAKDANSWFSTSLHGLVDSENSTTVPLLANATFTGTWKDCTDFNCIALGVYANQDSATDGLKYQFSADGVTVHHEHTYSYTVSAYGIGYTVPVEFKYYRIVFTNGAVNQTSFTIISTLKQTALFPSSYKLTQAITGQTQALFTRGVIVGETTAGGGGYVNVKVSPSGAIQVGGTVGLDAGTNAIGSVSVSNFPATQPVSGSVSVSNFPATQPVSAVSLPLPSGAATSTIQTDGTQKTQLFDSASGLSATITNSNIDAGSPSTNRLRVGSTLFGFNGTAIDRIRSGINGVITSLTGYMNTIWVGKYNATPPLLTDGQWVEPQFDVNGNLKISGTINATQGFVSGTLKSAQITVGTSQVRATTDGLAPSANRNKLMIKPSGVNTDSVFLIAAGGSTTTGMEIIGPDRLEFMYDPTDYYLISNSAGQVVEIVEVE